MGADLTERILNERGVLCCGIGSSVCRYAVDSSLLEIPQKFMVWGLYTDQCGVIFELDDAVIRRSFVPVYGSLK